MKIVQSSERTLLKKPSALPRSKDFRNHNQTPVSHASGNTHGCRPSDCSPRKRATPVVPTFPRETKAEGVVALAPPEEELGELEQIVSLPEGREGRGKEGEEGGPGPL